MLKNQFISSSLLPRKRFKVIAGTGMGMIPSGSVSDAVLYATLEKDFILKTSTRRDFGILYHARYKDDILIMAQFSFSSLQSLINEIRSRAFPFVIAVDSVSRSNCQMLDLDLSLSSCRVGGGRSKVLFRLYTKPSSIWQPLSPESSHHLGVHKFWPAAECNSIHSRFSDPKEGDLSVSRFCYNY